MKKVVLLAMLKPVIVTFIAPKVGAREDISYTGSSTIGENIIPEAAKLFTAKTGIRFSSIENPGSGKGLEALIEGKAVLVGVSRQLTKDEKKKGLFYEIIGYDAFGVFVHRNNPIKNLSKEALKGIFTGIIKNWKEVGGNDAPIICITETWGDKRATMIEFQRIAMDGLDYRADRKEVDRPHDQAAALASEENGIINVSFVYAGPEIKAASIDSVFPDPKSVSLGTYIYSRPLLLVTKGLPKGNIKMFLDFVLSPEGQKIVAKNFVPAIDVK